MTAETATHLFGLTLMLAALGLLSQAIRVRRRLALPVTMGVLLWLLAFAAGVYYARALLAPLWEGR